jgi:dihydrodipicolinate synthase/N-acetylneuraminate lyase
MNNIIGAMTALVTPFKNGKLDGQTFEKLIKHNELISLNINVIAYIFKDFDIVANQQLTKR